MVLSGSSKPLVERHDAALLDLDGVVYRGAELVPHAADAIAQARARGLRVAYVTNNAARPPAAVADQLGALGIPAGAQDVVTSAQAAAHLVADRVAVGSAVLVVGGAGITEALVERGLRPVRSIDDAPVAVVQGYAPDVDWRQLAEGTYAVGAGALWVATNTDLTIPTARGIAPGNGTLVQVIKTATGGEPVVAGKPEPPLLREAAERIGAARPLVVGDPLDTDIAGAVAVGWPSLLVLTGVTDPAMLVTAVPNQRPDFLAGDLRGLLEPHPPVRAADGEQRCGGWSATVADGRIELAGTGEVLDGLRAVCAAAWAYGGPGRTPTADRALAGLGL